MGYRKFSADYLFTGYQLLNNKETLITDANGTVKEIVSLEAAGDDVQFLKDIISPGLINCHCHLELSHLKNIIPPGTGLIEFLCSVVQKREAVTSSDSANLSPHELKMQAIKNAEEEMYSNGIAAVGDICNTADTVDAKRNSKIRWQNFIEVLSLTDEKAYGWIAHYTNVLHQFGQLANSRSSLSPHAPYTISHKTFQLLNLATANQIISIHNQEHPAEDELYKTGGGDYLKLFSIFGITKSPFTITGKGSIQSYLPYFNQGQTIFLIHNTYMPEEDVVFANNYAAENELILVYCLCPNANRYIEGKLPPFEMLIKNNCTVVLGTDSYSSNWQLSIAREIQALTEASQQNLERLLQCATINGAKALQWDDELGSFEKGKQPGIVLLKKDFSASQRIL